jgi:site-specific recombinase XerD
MKSKEYLNELMNKYIDSNLKTLKTIPSVKSAIKKFQIWMVEEDITFSVVNRNIYRQFDQGLVDKGYQRTSRTTTRLYIQKYFIWLYKKKVLTIHPELIFPAMILRKKNDVVLPKRALSYLKLIKIQYKKNTYTSYKTVLRCFYEFLIRHNISLNKFNRTHIELFMLEQKSNGHAESTRASRIITIRLYLRWANENGYIKFNPEFLIRNRDIPKVPDRLPRYLPSEIDFKIQEKLKSSDDIFSLGFLLMRSTGIRIGELKDLKFNCIREHSDGNFFLKVELGKLNTERLIPLDEKLVNLIYQIQKTCKKVCPEPINLIHYPTGRIAISNDFQQAFYDIRESLELEDHVVSHQLRHTYATQMLNAGMNMSILKEILGHKSLNMTSHYAKVTMETIVNEYFKATEIYQEKYLIKEINLSKDVDPVNRLAEVILSLNKQASEGNIKDKRDYTLIVRRLKRIVENLKLLS